MWPKHLLLLAAIGSAFLQDADMDYNDEDVTNFFDEVVVPMREAAKEALRPQAVVGPTNASSLQCSADQLTVRILEAARKPTVSTGELSSCHAALTMAECDSASEPAGDDTRHFSHRITVKSCSPSALTALNGRLRGRLPRVARVTSAPKDA